MAFQAHGSFSELSSSQETWTAYVECLEQYLAANKIEIDADHLIDYKQSSNDDAA